MTDLALTIKDGEDVLVDVTMTSDGLKMQVSKDVLNFIRGMHMTPESGVAMSGLLHGIGKIFDDGVGRATEKYAAKTEEAGAPPPEVQEEPAKEPED